MHKHTLLTVVATLLFDMVEPLVANLVSQEEQRKTEHVTVEMCLYKLEVLKTSDLPEQMLSVYYTGGVSSYQFWTFCIPKKSPYSLSNYVTLRTNSSSRSENRDRKYECGFFSPPFPLNFIPLPLPRWVFHLWLMRQNAGDTDGKFITIT